LWYFSTFTLTQIGHEMLCSLQLFLVALSLVKTSQLGASSNTSLQQTTKLQSNCQKSIWKVCNDTKEFHSHKTVQMLLLVHGTKNILNEKSLWKLSPYNTCTSFIYGRTGGGRHCSAWWPALCQTLTGWRAAEAGKAVRYRGGLVEGGRLPRARHSLEFKIWHPNGSQRRNYNPIKWIFLRSGCWWQLLR